MTKSIKADRPAARDTKPVLFAILLLVLSLAGTLLLYGQALGLPLFFDDMVHLRWLAGSAGAPFGGKDGGPTACSPRCSS